MSLVNTHAARNNEIKQQAAFEFITTYGWAILILVVATVMLYYFIGVPSTVSSAPCNFFYGVSCRGIVAASVNGVTKMTIVLSNSQSYPVLYPMARFITEKNGNVSTACLPDNMIIQSGGEILCNMTLPVYISPGASIIGTVYVNFTACPTGNMDNCQPKQLQTYVGSIITKATAQASNIHITSSSTSSTSTSTTVTSTSSTSTSSTSITSTSTSSTTTIAAVTVPPSIVAYVPISITNSQSTAVSAGTPIAIGTSSSGSIIGVDAVAYQQYETCNLNNAEFFLSNGMVLNSWMEGNMLNAGAANPSCTSDSSANALAASSNVLYWVDVPAGFLTSSAGGSPTNVLYLGWAGNVIDSANNMLTNGAGAGESPILSTSYGQYDNGATVFSLYFNGDTPIGDFNLGSTNQALQQISGVTIGSNANANVLYLTGYGSANRYDMIYNVPLQNGNYVLESNYKLLSAGLANNQGVVGLADTAAASTTGNAIAVDPGYNTGYFSQLYVSGGTDYVNLNTQGTAVSEWLYATANYIQTSATWEGFTAPQLYSSSGGYSGTATNPLGNSADIYLASMGTHMSGNPDYLYLNWMRARIYPPNGVMPATSFGSVS